MGHGGFYWFLERECLQTTVTDNGPKTGCIKHAVEKVAIFGAVAVTKQRRRICVIIIYSNYTLCVFIQHSVSLFFFLSPYNISTMHFSFGVANCCVINDALINAIMQMHFIRILINRLFLFVHRDASHRKVNV